MKKSQSFSQHKTKQNVGCCTDVHELPLQVPLETDKPNPQQGRDTKISNKSKSPELHCKNFVPGQTLGVLAPMAFFAEISFCRNPQLFFQNVLMILQINLKLVIFGSSSQIEKLSKWRHL